MNPKLQEQRNKLQATSGPEQDLAKCRACGLHFLGACQLQLSRYQEAFTGSLTSGKLLEELGNKPVINRVRNVIGNFYRHLGDYNNASEYNFSVLGMSFSFTLPAA